MTWVGNAEGPAAHHKMQGELKMTGGYISVIIFEQIRRRKLNYLSDVNRTSCMFNLKLAQLQPQCLNAPNLRHQRPSP